MFVVVCTTLIIQTIVSKGPIVFLRLAQLTNGEIDAYLMPPNEENSAYDFDNVMPISFNYTKINETF